jgi:hypothetical protein
MESSSSLDLQGLALFLPDHGGCESTEGRKKRKRLGKGKESGGRVGPIALPSTSQKMALFSVLGRAPYLISPSPSPHSAEACSISETLFPY